MQEEKKLSCGVIVTDGTKLLAIIPWGKKHQLDIPKGGIDEGESPRDCAARELFEETGLVVAPSRLTDLGETPYNQFKTLHLFLMKTKLPNIRNLKCTSFFTNPYGKEVPEAAGFEYVEFNDPRFYQSLKPILRIIQNHF